MSASSSSFRAVDVSSYLASAIAQALPPAETDSVLSPEAHAFESVRSMTRSELDAALRAAKIEGLADDVWASIQRLNAGRKEVASAMEKLEKRESLCPIVVETGSLLRE